MTSEQDRPVRPEDFEPAPTTGWRRRTELAGQALSASVGMAEPLTMREHLELVAAGVAVARYADHPALVNDALVAGASWEQIAAARGTTATRARADHRAWADQQRWLHEETGKFGLGPDAYDAALRRSAEATGTQE